MPQSFFPGRDFWYAIDSPTSSFSAIFEDDGNTGYFYACNRDGADPTVVDAIHIYSVDNVVDREQESTVDILWSPDGLKAALLINARPRAVIDFAARCAYSPGGLPASTSLWNRGNWFDGLMDFFAST